MPEKNQILITISEDKQKITIAAGGDCAREMSFQTCPTKPLEGVGNAINSFMKLTGLGDCPEWRKEERCGNCLGCN